MSARDAIDTAARSGGYSATYNRLFGGCTVYKREGADLLAVGYQRNGAVAWAFTRAGAVQDEFLGAGKRPRILDYLSTGKR